jgi:hypothetical protein
MEPGVLATTLVVRDEDDILESNLEYHAGSGRVRWLREVDRPHDRR